LLNIILSPMSEMASTSKRVTVEDASPSPPPLPKEHLPAPAVAEPVDQPIESLGDDDSEEEEWDDEWDPAAKRLPGEANEKGKGKGKGKEANGDGQPWQAVWAPERNGGYCEVSRVHN